DGPRFTISLKRSTQNLQLSTSSAGRLPHLYPRKRTWISTVVMSAKGQFRTRAPQRIVELFNHLVSPGEEHRGHFEVERLGSFQIDEELEFVGPIDRDVARLGPVEDLVHVDGKTLGELA